MSDITPEVVETLSDIVYQQETGEQAGLTTPAPQFRGAFRVDVVAPSGTMVIDVKKAGVFDDDRVFVLSDVTGKKLARYVVKEGTKKLVEVPAPQGSTVILWGIKEGVADTVPIVEILPVAVGDVENTQKAIDKENKAEKADNILARALDFAETQGKWIGRAVTGVVVVAVGVFAYRVLKETKSTEVKS